MRASFAMVTVSAFAGLLVALAPALAQQKTVRACQDEWRANRAANQAAGITEKDFIATCRGGSTAAAPIAAPSKPAVQTAAPAAPTAAPSKPAAETQQKTVRACQDEWRANRAANQAAGITEKDFVATCRAGGTAAAPTAAPSKPAVQTAAPAAETPTPAARRPATVGVAVPTSPAPSATGANQFSSEALARAHCASDTVVWANLGSRIYHFSGHKDFGNTKEGAYMCEKDAVGQGIRAAKNEKHP